MCIRDRETVGDIQPRLGLVENQNIGIVQKRGRDQHALLHPLRIIREGNPTGVMQVKQLEKLVGPLGYHCLLYTSVDDDVRAGSDSAGLLDINGGFDGTG